MALKLISSMKIFFNQYSDRGRGAGAIWQIWLNLNWCGTLKNLKILDRRHAKLYFYLDIQAKCGNIADEILNAAIDAEWTFNYGWPKVRSWRYQDLTQENQT